MPGDWIAVVLVPGLDSAADVWTGYQPDPSLAVFARVARFARVCAYDRPGAPVGDNLTPSRSTPVPQPTTAQDAVRDLHALLRAAGEPGPYVLAGHSYGGLITRLYAGEYRQNRVIQRVITRSAASGELLEQGATSDRGSLIVVLLRSWQGWHPAWS